VNCGCHRPRYYRPACCGYYSLYTYATPCGCGCGCGCGGGCGYWGSGWGWGGGLLGGIFGW
jgi:hypothetical protein